MFFLPGFAESDHCFPGQSQQRGIIRRNSGGEFEFAEDLIFPGEIFFRGVKVEIPVDKCIKLLPVAVSIVVARSEERRGGKECRSRWSP